MKAINFQVASSGKALRWAENKIAPLKTERPQRVRGYMRQVRNLLHRFIMPSLIDLAHPLVPLRRPIAEDGFSIGVLPLRRIVDST